MANPLPRLPHPFDLTPDHLNQLWNLQESSSDPLLSLSPKNQWRKAYPHGEVLTLVMLASGEAGPLSESSLDSFRCSVDKALLAAFVGRAWGLARNPTQKGILAGKPGYEAWTMLCGRVRAARTNSPNWSGWWLTLLEGLKVKPEQVPQEYALIWSSIVPTLSPWNKCKGDEAFWSDVQNFAGLMAREPSWRWQYLELIATHRKDCVPSYLNLETTDGE